MLKYVSMRTDSFNTVDTVKNVNYLLKIPSLFRQVPIANYNIVQASCTGALTCLHKYSSVSYLHKYMEIEKRNWL